MGARPFDPIDFLDRAVRTPSHGDVSAMRELLVEALAAAGLDPETDGAGNVLASRGSGRPHVVLNTHLDTVGPPLPVERDDGVLRGRGACDAKGPLAAYIDAFRRAEPRGRLTLAVTPDEETDSTGAAALELAPDAAIVGEPTGLDICNAAKGRFVATVTVEGEHAHAAEAASGVNAIRAAAPILEALDGFDAERGPPDHEALGPPLLTPTVIRGGEATNQVPDECTITLDRRSVPPETAAAFREALAAHVRAAAPAAVTVSVALRDRPTPYLTAFSTPADEAVVRTLQRAAGGAVRPFSAATEAAYFAETAPTVVFGPGDLVDDRGAVAHADREYVRLADVRAAADALVEALGAL